MMGWFVTLVGPVLYAARGWLPGAGFVRALKVGLYVTCLGGGVVGGIWLTNWWQGDRLTEKQAQVKCNMAIAEAEIEAKRIALEHQRRAIEERETQVIEDELSIASQILKMKETRDASAKSGDPGGVFVRADDSWLQSQRARSVDRASRR